MENPVQQQSRKTRHKYWTDFLRLFVFYPLAWIIVSVVLFHLVTK